MLSKNPCSVSIEGVKIDPYVSIKITQKINDHHEFEVVLDNESFIKEGNSDIFSSKDYIGKSILINIDKYDFLGRITGIDFKMQKGKYGHTRLKGYSKTILLESGNHLRSFTGKDLSSIVKTILDGAKMRGIINPKKEDPITYHCQYNESDYKYLQRLAKQYNEWLYYDGEYIVFGKPRNSKNVIPLEYGQDIYEVNIRTEIGAVKQLGYDFNYLENNVISSNSANDKAMSSTSEYGLNASLGLYPNHTQSLPETVLENKYEVDQYVKGKTESALGNFDILEAKSKQKGLEIGSVIKVSSEGKHLGETYMIVEIEHTQSEDKEYENIFQCIPAGSVYLPEPELPTVYAGLQRAIVIDNEDDLGKGRVKVRMLWQTGDMTTDWLQVLAPDAGSSDVVNKNRGYVFVPEVGDQVMVGFHYNDPNRPFVLGGLHHSESAEGGQQNNTIKSIKTRSGHIIEFNDTKQAESIKITDKSKNIIFIDTANSSIQISAPENISISAKNIDITASENLTASAGENMGINAGDDITMGAGKDMTITASEDMSILAKNITEQASEEFLTDTDSMENHAKEISRNSTNGSIEFHSKEEVKNNTAKKSKLF